MEIRILGPTEVVVGDVPVPLPRGRARSLLGILALNAGQVVSADRLIDELWGESPPATVATALQGLVHKLRGCLEPQRSPGESPTILLTRSPGYWLDVAPEGIDSNRFRHMVAEAAGAPSESAVEVLRRALALWRGSALADFRYEPFAQAEIADLEELRLSAVEKRIGAELALGRHRDLVGELERLTAQHPLRETLHGLLMLALYRSDRQTDALHVYADLRARLVGEMGLDPSIALQELEELILRQDQTLDLGEVAVTKPAVATELPISEERKIVTVLSVDVGVSNGEDGRPLDAEVSQRILERHLRKATAVIAGHGGSVEASALGALIGVFGVPISHEDDALRATRAAVDLRHLIAATNTELGEPVSARINARIGIDTGEVIVGDRTVATSSIPVRSATQLHRAAHEGEILIGEATRVLVGNAVLAERRTVDVGDGTDRAAWSMLDLMPRTPAIPLSLEASLVGREAEMDIVGAVYERVVEEGEPRRLMVIGQPGIGKTRLARELESMVEAEARVLTGHCPAYGDGITFFPLKEMVEAAVGSVEPERLLDWLGHHEYAEQVAEHVMTMTGRVDGDTSPTSVFPMIRRFFEALTNRGPVVLILEDLHWAQPTFLDLVDHITREAETPILIMCLARPEFLDAHADWVEGERTTSLTLEPLGVEESRRLAANRLSGRVVPDDVLNRVLSTALGNPLFVEQLVATIVEEGDFTVPSTLQALLAARIDRLGPAERDIVRVASVLGHRFPEAALISLLPVPVRAHVPRHLRSLEKKELLVRGVASEEETSGFRHVLIQQSAYRSMTMQTRAELHERAANWLETEAVEEFEETVGYHLEHAYRYRKELGVLDEHTRVLAERAGEKLADAGLRAFTNRLDAAGAENLLGHAEALLPHDHPILWEVRFRLAEAHETMGRHDEADSVLSKLVTTEPGTSSRRVVLELERARVRFAIGPDPTRLDEIAQLATRALGHFEGVGNEAGMAQALFILGEVSRRRGHIAEMEGIVRRGLEHADRSDSGREQLGARRLLATALEVGPTPVSDCIEACEECLTWRGQQSAAVLPILAHLHAMQGQFDRARDMITRAESLLEEQARARRPLTLLGKRRAEVEALAGNLDTAEQALQTALQLDLDLGIREEASEAAALLARLQYMRQRPEEAARMAELSQEKAPSESVTTQGLWRSVSALVAATRGDGEDAVRLVETAVELVPETMLNLRADIFLDTAETLETLGYAEQAEQSVKKAIDLYTRKGNRAASAQARSRMSI